jgi:predicted Rossmann fold nucleotide-binding protein DprA/Smf involved in DNA uptake
VRDVRTITIQLSEKQIANLRDSLRSEIESTKEHLSALKSQLAQLDNGTSVVMSAPDNFEPTNFERVVGRVKRGQASAVIAAALNGTPRTADEIAKITGASIATVHRKLGILLAMGRAEKNGKTWIRKTLSPQESLQQMKELCGEE